MSEDTSKTITVCGVHEDTVKLLEALRSTLEEHNIQQAKIATSLGWIKWIAGGMFTLAFAVVMAGIPFMSNLHTRVVILEKKERISYETSERGTAQSILRPSERRELRGSVEMVK